MRRRAAGARGATAAAAELAARDPAAVAAEVVAEERARLAGDALAVIRRAVEAMHRDAVAAERELDPRSLAAVQEGGRAAVAELRRLLGLLRSDAEPAASDRLTREANAEKTGPWPLRRVDVLIAAGLIASGLVDVTAWAAGSATGSIALTLTFAATAAFARADAAAACLLAAVPSGLAAALDAPLVYGFSTVIARGVLAWWAGVDGRPRSLLALAALLAVTVVVVIVLSARPGLEVLEQPWEKVKMQIRDRLVAPSVLLTKQVRVDLAEVLEIPH